MFKISANHLEAFETTAWSEWRLRLTNVMAELLPDVAAAYTPQEWWTLIDSLLRRADMYAMWEEGEAVAYCYGSLTLGVGFESRPDLPSFASALALAGRPRADAIWDGLEISASYPGVQLGDAG